MQILLKDIYFFVLMWYNCLNEHFSRKGAFMKPIKLSVGDKVELKKSHPCGGNLFEILRVGSDVRIRCITCSHDMTIDRIKLEKSIKKLIHVESEES